MGLITSKEAGWITFAFLSPGRSKIIFKGERKERDRKREGKGKRKKKKKGRWKEDKNKGEREVGNEEGKRMFGGC